MSIVDPALFRHIAEWNLWVKICELEGKDPGPKPAGLEGGSDSGREDEA